MFCDAVQLATVVKGPSCTLKSQLSSGICQSLTLLHEAQGSVFCFLVGSRAYM